MCLDDNILVCILPKNKIKINSALSGNNRQKQDPGEKDELKTRASE